MNEPTKYEMAVAQMLLENKQEKDNNGDTLAKLRRAMRLISRIYEDLPSCRNWLDPNYELEMKVIHEIEESDRQRQAQEKADHDEWLYEQEMHKRRDMHDFLGERDNGEEEE